MAIFPIGMAHYLMVGILISRFMVKRTGSRFATYTDKQHQEISADILERKLGIGLNKANWTIQYTTKYNVGSALEPLTRKHRKYLMTQRLRHMNWIYYTYTLFGNDKPIVRNTCAHIFTDGVFFQTIPMIYKSEAGTKLYRINWDIVVAKKIFMGNSLKQTGNNTEMHRVEIMSRRQVWTTEP